MAKRRANGEGNIRKRADGRWEGRCTAGHDPATGKQIFKNVPGESQAEVKEKLSAAIRETAGLDILKAEQYTVETWLQFWLDNFGKMTMPPSTFESYSGNLRVHIKPHIDGIKLTKLRTSGLQKFYSKLLTEGRIVRKESKKQPKGLSPKTVRNVHIFISTALDKAVAEKLIPYNPAKGCKLPKGEHIEMKTLPLDNIAASFAEAKNSGVYEMYLLEIVTGLRRGELLGLKWTDVDYNAGRIYVQRQICRIDGVDAEGPLKTKNSYRKNLVPSDVMAVLEDKQKKDNGASEYVFFSPLTNGPISPDILFFVITFVCGQIKNLSVFMQRGCRRFQQPMVCNVIRDLKIRHN